jgi:hypothetical protein
MDTAYERRAWTLVYVCLGIIEGRTAAVMVRSLFGAAVPPLLVDLVLAVVSAAPAWANLASLAYARRAQGRPKVDFLRPLLVAMALSRRTTHRRRTICVAPRQRSLRPASLLIRS